MRGSIAEFVDIQEWASDTLKNNSEFTQFCVDIIGSELGFYSSFPVKRILEEEDLPCIIFYTEVMQGSNISTEDFFRTWTLPFLIQIIPSEDSVDINGVKTWASTKIIKQLIYKACEILENEACKIGSGDIRFLEIESLTTTDIEEADDLQAQVFISFGQDNSL